MNRERLLFIYSDIVINAVLKLYFKLLLCSHLYLDKPSNFKRYATLLRSYRDVHVEIKQSEALLNAQHVAVFLLDFVLNHCFELEEGKALDHFAK